MLQRRDELPCCRENRCSLCRKIVLELLALRAQRRAGRGVRDAVLSGLGLDVLYAIGDNLHESVEGRHGLDVL